MVAPPVLHLFGVPALEAGGARAVFTTERPFQLLCHLACRRQWIRRDELADVLWPEHDQAHARSNLRKVLLLAARVPGVEAIERQGDLLRWLPDSDLGRFEAACAERRVADAIELGAAPFLEGFESAFVGVGAAWLLSERRRVEALWQAACLQRLAELAGQLPASARLARRMLARDPLDEVAVQAVARVHLALGEPEIAAREIANYANRLHEEVGVEPTAAIRELASAAAEGSSRPMPLGTGAKVDRDTAFIGRRAELRELGERLEHPDCRLLTLTGPGGIGKTSTAGMLAKQLVPAIADSVVAVPLADLTEADQVPARIASSIGLTLRGGGEPWAQLGAAIGRRSLALLLDNAEQLALAAPLGRLLDAAPCLRLVVTSRVRLGLAAETAYALVGLPLPDDDETDVDVLRCCDAVALFEARALAASRTFDFEAQAADVVRLVHQLEGLPLAIELAANWTRLLPVAEIADEIERSVDLLESFGGAERSLRVSFAQSWRLLSASERACLPQLALLPGDFGRDMALQVAGASLPVIAALVDKSLLRSDGRGRFSMHALLGRCAAEYADPEAHVMARLAIFVARWLGDFADPQTSIPSELVDAIEREIPHVRAAWAWALACGDRAVLAGMARPLSTYFEVRGMWTEGLAALGRAVEVLATAGGAAARERALTYRALAVLQYRSGALEAAEVSAREVIAYAAPADDGQLLMSALNTAGLSLWQRGRFEEARAAFEQALQRARREGSERGIGTFLSNIGMVDKALGRYQAALEAYESLLPLDRDPSSRTTTINNLANVERALGRPGRAIERLNEALVMCTQHGLKSVRPHISINLGLSHTELGHFDVARTWLATALDEARQWGEPMIEMAALLALAHLDVVADVPAAARLRVWDALSISDRLESASTPAQCVAAFGEILARETRLAEGLALMRWASAQPGIGRLDRDITERRIAALIAHQGGEPPPFELPPGAPLQAALAVVVASR